MRVAVTGATGVLGRQAVHALVGAGHEVVGHARSSERAHLLHTWGAEPVAADFFDVAALTAIFRGCDTVVNLATHVPVGYAQLWPWSWRAHDRIRSRGAAGVVAAAEAAGVRRVVQESVSFVYADHGEEWVTEEDSIDITPATEPVAVAEAKVTGFTNGVRTGVVLRLGTLVGDDELTRFQLRSVARGRPIGLGRPEGWAHVLHVEDVGPAVLAALAAPGGIFNVGAEPVRRAALVAGFAAAAGVDHGGFLGPTLSRLAGPRVEPLSRSLRVCSEHFSAQTGWAPRHREFGADWLPARRMHETAA